MITKEQKLNNYFIGILESTSTLSTCYRVKVGAIIVQNGRIISSGYNGTPSGILECEEYKQILSPLFSKIGKGEIKKQDEAIQYILQGVIDLKKGYENNKELLEFISEENEKYLTNIYLQSLYSEYQENEDRKSLRTEFLYRNNMFHSDNSILGEVHAEQNALLYASKSGYSLDGCDLYCNYLPCQTCSKLIKQAGIKRVFYMKEYEKNGTKSTKFFKLNGIELKKIKKIEDKKS